MVLPEPYFSLSDSRDTSCAIRFFSEPVPQLRDSWDNTWCYRKPRRYMYINPRCVVAERSSALDSSSGVVRMWVRIPAWPVAALVSLSNTLNPNCFVLRMGRKAVGPVCCVMHVKEPRSLVKEKALALSTQQGGYVRATNLLYYCIIIITTTRVKISQNLYILTKVYLVHLRVVHVSTFTG